MRLPALMTSDEVAQEMGYVDRSAIHHRINRGDVRLAACRLPGPAHRSWSRSRLIAAGYLCAAPAPVVAAAPLPNPAPMWAVASWRVA